MGLPIPVPALYEAFDIPFPEEDARTLSYDDQDLFQYHLQYGILTVNEVRSRLGLNPIAGGDVPTNRTAPAPAPRSGVDGPPPPSAPHGGSPSREGDNPEASVIEEVSDPSERRFAERVRDAVVRFLDPSKKKRLSPSPTLTSASPPPWWREPPLD